MRCYWMLAGQTGIKDFKYAGGEFSASQLSTELLEHSRYPNIQQQNSNKQIREAGGNAKLEVFSR